MSKNKMWNKFRDTGLLLYINQILHVFGWAIVCEIDENNNVTNAYPDRVKFRGFSEESVERSYIKISKYMKNNASKLFDEACDSEPYDDACDFELQESPELCYVLHNVNTKEKFAVLDKKIAEDYINSGEYYMEKYVINV